MYGRYYPHTALLPAALPPTIQRDGLAVSIRHTSVGTSAVDVIVPQPDCLAVSDDAALSMPPALLKRSPLLH